MSEKLTEQKVLGVLKANEAYIQGFWREKPGPVWVFCTWRQYRR